MATIDQMREVFHTPRSRLLVAVASIAVGAALLGRNSHDYFLIAFGAGLGAQRWVSWKYVLAVAGVVFAFDLALTLARGREARDFASSTAGLLLSACFVRWSKPPTPHDGSKGAA